MEANWFKIREWDINYNDITKLKTWEIPPKDFQERFKKEIQEVNLLQLLTGFMVSYLEETDVHVLYCDGGEYPHWKHIIILNYLIDNYDK